MIYFLWGFCLGVLLSWLDIIRLNTFVRFYLEPSSLVKR